MSSLEPLVRVPSYLRSNYRRTIIIGVAAGVVGLAVCLLTGHPVIGLFGCIGILLGAVNLLLVHRSIGNYGPENEGDKMRVIVTSVGPRLIVITVIALALSFLFRPDGVAAFGGLALFQFVTLANTAMSVKRGMRQS
jgi:hypothetical protein